MSRREYGGMPDEFRCVERQVPPDEVPVDAFACAACGAVLWMMGQTSVWHDCATGEVGPS